MKDALPSSTQVVIVGAGFAGAATAWALGRLGVGSGVVLEQELGYGMHASGKNAALLRLAEADPIILPLSLLSFDRIRGFDRGAEEPLFNETGGLTLAGHGAAARIEHEHVSLRDAGLMTFLLSASETRERFPLLKGVDFEVALWCPSEGVVDIHALLTRYIHDARATGFQLFTECSAEELLTQAGRVTGVRTSHSEIRADLVIDASGAWAGRLGRASAPLPLRPLRRHLFVSGAGWRRRGSAVRVARRRRVLLSGRGRGGALLLYDRRPPRPARQPYAPPRAARRSSRTRPVSRPSSRGAGRACTFARSQAGDRPHPIVRGCSDSGLGGFGMTTSAAVGSWPRRSS
jgi:glycine/D-amino acid oxidase-like deaminating enzyme